MASSAPVRSAADSSCCAKRKTRWSCRLTRFTGKGAATWCLLRTAGSGQSDRYKVFHVRKVRPGARDTTPAGLPITEVIAGVLPGERIAVTNSGVLRSELLRNNLGAG